MESITGEYELEIHRSILLHVVLNVILKGQEVGF